MAVLFTVAVPVSLPTGKQATSTRASPNELLIINPRGLWAGYWHCTSGFCCKSRHLSWISISSVNDKCRSYRKKEKAACGLASFLSRKKEKVASSGLASLLSKRVEVPRKVKAEPARNTRGQYPLWEDPPPSFCKTHGRGNSILLL